MANDKNKPECILFLFDKVCYVETAAKRNKTILSSNYQILTKSCIGNVYNW